MRENQKFRESLHLRPHNRKTGYPKLLVDVSELRSVEINRGRGVINDVETPEEAFAWFEEMAKRR